MQSPARDASNPPDAPALAGYGDRFLATLVDAIVFVAVFWVVGTWAAGKWGGATATGFNLHGSAAGVTIGLVLLISLAYYWLGEGLFGATLGKALIGIRVRRLDGGPISLGAALVRTLLRLIDGIAVYLVGLAVAALSKRRQRIGDHLAHTV
ncbi:MAG: RDD family protein, partial [Gemmatimonadaceae bacterium]|nr:RDD family protein [Gemmatimonadaceae bacterium]